MSKNQQNILASSSSASSTSSDNLVNEFPNTVDLPIILIGESHEDKASSPKRDIAIL